MQIKGDYRVASNCSPVTATLLGGPGYVGFRAHLEEGPSIAVMLAALLFLWPVVWCRD